MPKTKIIIAIFALLLSTGCARKNATVATVTDSAKETIEMVIREKPECKTVGDVCKKEIDVIETICNQEISNEKDRAWKRGFMYGIITCLAIFVGIMLSLWRFMK